MDQHKYNAGDSVELIDIADLLGEHDPHSFFEGSGLKEGLVVRIRNVSESGSLSIENSQGKFLGYLNPNRFRPAQNILQTSK